VETGAELVVPPEHIVGTENTGVDKDGSATTVTVTIL